MAGHNIKIRSAIYITFAGNCKVALTFYQSCFGGRVHFDTIKIKGFTAMPVVSGSLVSDRLIIHGSDLVHDEGRLAGNYMAVFLQCENASERKKLVQKLTGNQKRFIQPDQDKLIEVRDPFDVRWVLGSETR